MIGLIVFGGIILLWLYNLCKLITYYIEYIVRNEYIDNTLQIFNYTFNIFSLNFICILLLFNSNIYYYVLTFIYIINIIQFYTNYRLYNRTIILSHFVTLLFLHYIILYVTIYHITTLTPIIFVSVCIIIGLI